MRRAALFGALAGSVVVLWMLTRGTFDLLRRQAMGDFFDAQAHAFCRGELFIDPSVLKVEASPGTGGHAYMYFGPWPALLRVPVAAWTDHLDGRLSILSILLAYGIALWALIAVAGDAAARTGSADRLPARPSRWAITGLFAVLSGGSSLLFLASVAWVFHEATAWGVAWSLVTCCAAVRVIDDTNPRSIALAGIAALLTVLSRVSIGLGTVAMLGLIAAWTLYVPARRRFAPLILLASATPLAVYMAVNHAKFGTLSSVPFLTQTATVIDPERQVMLAQNHGTLFGLKFAPTTLLAYLRPDGLRFSRCFPFVDFPLTPGKVVGGVLFDKFDFTASATATLPLLLVLAAVGAVAAARRRALFPYRLVLPGLALGAVAIIPFADIAHRYLTDAFPFLATASVVGLVASPFHAPKDRPKLLSLALLGAWTAWTNFGLALLYQRIYTQVRERPQLAQLLSFQLTVDQWLHSGSPWPVKSEKPMPVRSGRAEMYVVGDCEALYYGDGHKPSSLEHVNWIPVERTEAAGHFEIAVPVRVAPAGAIEPILSVAELSGAPDVIGLEHLGNDRVRVIYIRRAFRADGAAVEAPAGRVLNLSIDADRALGVLAVREGTRDLLSTYYFAGTDDYRVGSADGVPGVTARYPATITRRRVPEAPLCHRIRALAGH